MQKDDRLACASCAGGVVVDPRTVEIDELTAHGGGVECEKASKWRLCTSCGKMTRSRIRDKR